MNIIATNAGGIPYITSTNTTVGTETIDIALGFRRIQPVGYLTIAISDVIPADATTTLPVTLTMNFQMVLMLQQQSCWTLTLFLCLMTGREVC